MTSEVRAPLNASEPLARWSARSVGIGEVSRALSELRHSEQSAATRTSVVNLVVAAGDSEAAGRAASAMRRLGKRHPGRTLALVCRPEEPEDIDASVELHAAAAEDATIWWEEVHLELGGALCEHLASVVTPLLLAELPTAVWFPSALPAPDDPLLDLADVALVDARWALQAGSGLAALVELGRRQEVIDLSWCRLTPWRRLLASLFEPAAMRPYLGAVTAATVSANPGPGRLLAGWVIDRLGVASAAVTLTRAVHASIALH
ncbi:MAG: glucose-6-phosphate dehydrogenase assembly protein OpcA, partial [Acidimicrobiales bacterium]